MSTETRPPERIIHDWLTANGPIEVGVSALEQTWKRRPLGRRDRREIAAALEGVGVRCEPPLTELPEGEQMRLSVEPEPEVAPADRIRERLEAEGPVSVLLEELAAFWSIDAPKARDRRQMAADLKEAGVYTDPPLRGLRHGEAIGLSLEPPAPAPEPVATQPEPEPEPEPAPPPPSPDEPVAAAESEPDEAGTPISTRVLIALGGVFAVMVVGALGPWSKAVFVVDTGLDREGWFVLGAAVAAAAVLALYLYANAPSWFPMLSAAIGAFSTATVAGDYHDLLDDSLLSPTWGIYLAFAGSAALVVLSMFLLVKRDE